MKAQSWINLLNGSAIILLSVGLIAQSFVVKRVLRLLQDTYELMSKIVSANTITVDVADTTARALDHAEESLSKKEK